MRLSEAIAWGAFFLAGVADAIPAKKKNDECTPKATCKKIKHALGNKAVQACSAYLGPRTKTVTVTKTVLQTARKTTQLPQQTEFATIDRTTTLFRTSEETRYSDDPTATITETVQGTVTSTTTTYIYNEPIKRHVATVNPVLRDIEKRHPKSFVSQACSCVYKPTTKTVTRTGKVTKYTTQTSTKAAPPPVKVTDTRDVSITEHVTITATLGPTSTVTSKVISTVDPDPYVVIQPAVCIAYGRADTYDDNYRTVFNTNLADCMDTCKTDSRCLSTGFYDFEEGSPGPLSGTCRYFKKPVLDGSVTLGVPEGIFSDKDCPLQEDLWG